MNSQGSLLERNRILHMLLERLQYSIGLLRLDPQRDQFAHQGVAATLEAVRKLATLPVYVSLDIDCVDPAFAPGTGTPEVAGLSSREIVEMVRGLRGLSLVAFDVVEVCPPYDSSEITALLAANLVYELLMVLAAK